MTTLLIATRNPGKLAELDRIVRAAGITGLELLGLQDVAPFEEAPEIAPDFAGNALAKAQDAYAATGLPAIADDSGLAIDALNGMPGVLSARWSGSHGADKANVDLVLAQLGDVPDERRGAAFICAAVLVAPGAEPTVVQGEWRGRIVREPRGSNGFGYDPIFVPDEEPGHTSAELDPARKDALSHRAKALAALIPALRALA